MALRIGFTLPEVVILVAVLAIVAGTLLRMDRGQEVLVSARALVLEFQLQRAAAAHAGAPTHCLERGIGGPSIATWPPRGLLFTPDGLPRTCDGGGVGNTTILLEHRGRHAAVIVSSLGRVRWELR